jgi:hypothetical protein
VSPAKILTPGQKWQFAEYALQHAYEALDKLIHVIRHGESKTAVTTAADKILDRALGKAPQNVDISALRLAMARVMIDAVDPASGFCTTPIAEIAKRACCTPRSVTKARAALCKSGLWIAGPSGVFASCPDASTSGLSRNQRPEKTMG